VENLARGKTTFDEGILDLARLAESPPVYPLIVRGLFWVIASAAFAALLAGFWHDVMVSSALGVLTFVLFCLSQRFQRLGSLLTVVAPFLSGFVAQGIFSSGIPIKVPFVLCSSIVMLLPGLALTVAMSEISARQLISGSSRLVEAVMNLLLLLFGAIMGVSSAVLLWPMVSPSTAPIVISAEKTWPAVLLLALSLTVVFNIPWRKAIWGLIACVIAFGSAQLTRQAFGTVAGMFVGSLAVGLYSNCFARIAKAPSSVLSTQGILLLVPGSMTYMIMNQWFVGTQIIPGAAGSQALLLFVALVAGLLFSNALLPPGKSL
jgi:uncharacterized membrane protein YjjP (DUF1212 family)